MKLTLEEIDAFLDWHREHTPGRAFDEIERICFWARKGLELEATEEELADQIEYAAIATIRAVTAEARYKAMQEEDELPDIGSHYLGVLRKREDAVCTWAADEIERLQIEHDGAHNARDIAWEENDRLKRDNATLLRTIAKFERQIERLRQYGAENAKLREALGAVVEFADRFLPGNPTVEKARAALQKDDGE